MNPTYYDQIGEGYDRTRTADPQLTERLVAHLNPQEGYNFLDLGSGTGNYTAALKENKLDITGIDPSEEMIRLASKKFPEINWKIGAAEKIPFEDESFDGVVTTLTIHLWESLIKGFREINRVTKENGRLVIFTAMPHQMEHYWLNEYFPEIMSYYMNLMPGYPSLQATLGATGWRLKAVEKYFISEELKDLFLYSGKHRPELYFESGFRSGIFVFSTHHNPEDVQKGLEKLRADMDSGRFEEVQKKYENNQGDYLFLVAEKKSTTDIF
ncbi:MAG: class I SAM-dependent methyltransferase [Bacteroidia bacterium]|nr:class I SAM-dependent methyltransferase [Bacteroidia bacterium]